MSCVSCYIKMASATTPVLDPLGKGTYQSAHGETSLHGEEPSQGTQKEPGTSCYPDKEPGTTISHITSLFSAVNVLYSRKTSLVQLFHIFDSLTIKTKTVQYFATPRPSHMEGIFCKNIFLKDRKNQFYLVICSERVHIDLKKLKALVHAHRNFSFAPVDDLEIKLALTSGAVSPFGLINDPKNSIRFIVDRSLVNEAKTRNDLLNFHPFVDFLTTLISCDDLMKFVNYCGHEVELVDL